MHHCLNIPEIVAYICSYLTNADLLSTALTCQDFRPIALQALWHHLQDLSPVIRSLPCDAWEVDHWKGAILYGSRVENVCEYTLIRRLIPRDWDPLLPYLPMIHTINSNPTVVVSGGVLRGMLKSFPGDRIFPNIRGFSLLGNIATNSTVEFIHSLLLPQLQNLSINLDPGSRGADTLSFVSSIPSLCPSIKTLELTGKGLDPSAISGAVCQLQHLEELIVPSLSEAAFIHVSQLPRLRKLITDGPGYYTLQLPSIPLPTFPALIQLGLHGGTASFHTSIHKTMNSQNYEEYSGEFYRVATAGELNTLFNQLKNVASHAFHTIVLDCDEKPQGPENHGHEYSITRDALQPILTFSSLKILEMPTIFTFDVDDAFTLDLAMACPKLESVDLGASWSSGKRSRATLMSYSYLVRHCENLRSLGLVVDASRGTGGDPLTARSTEGKAYSIRSEPHKGYCFQLKVGDSFIADSYGLVPFFGKLLHAKHLYKGSIQILTPEDCPLDIRHAWALVEKMLDIFVHMMAAMMSGFEPKDIIASLIQ